MHKFVRAVDPRFAGTWALCNLTTFLIYEKRGYAVSGVSAFYGVIKMFAANKTLISAAAAMMLMPCLTAAADEGLIFSLAENAAIRSDGVIPVTVAAEKNPGVQSWVLVLCYDSGAVEFSGVEEGIFGRLTVSDDKAGRLTVNCFGGDITAEGTAFTALFVPKSAAVSYDFTLVPSEDEGDFFNFAGDDVACSVSRGKLTVALDKADISAKAVSPSVEQTSADSSETVRESNAPQEKSVSAAPADADSAADVPPQEPIVSEPPADISSSEETVYAPAPADESPAALPQTEKQNAAASEPPSGGGTAERPSATGGALPLTAFVSALAAGAAVVSRRR